MRCSEGSALWLSELRDCKDILIFLFFLFSRNSRELFAKA